MRLEQRRVGEVAVDQSAQIISVGISVNMNKEFLKPFDLSGTIKVNDVRPDVSRCAHSDFTLLDKCQTISAQCNHSGFAGLKNL